jgi:hypothetical protein
MQPFFANVIEQRNRRRLVQCVFMLLGVGVLVPWNAFVSAATYFSHRLCLESIESIFAMTFNVSSVTSLGCILLCSSLWTTGSPNDNADGQLLTEQDHETIYENAAAAETLHDNTTAMVVSKNKNSLRMVMLPLAVSFVAFVAQTALVLVPSVSTVAFQALTLACLVACGLMASIVNAGIVAMCSEFPADVAIRPYFQGQAMGGLVVSAANFVAAAWENPDEYWNANCQEIQNQTVPWTDSQASLSDYAATDRELMGERLWRSSSCSPYKHVDWAVFAYFFFGACALVACLFGFAYIHRLNIKSRADTYQLVNAAESAALSEEPLRIEMEAHQLQMHNCNNHEVNLFRTSAHSTVADGIVVDAMSKLSHTNSLYGEHSPLATEDEDATAQDDDDDQDAWTHARGPAATTFLTFLVTLALFPGWTSQLQSARQCQTKVRLWNDLFVSFTFVLFNAGDLTGRLLSGKISLGTNPTRMSDKLVSAALLRFVFFPLLYLCVGGYHEKHRAQIPSDVYSIAVQFLLAVTNGLLVSVAFAHAASLRTTRRERTSEILSFALSFGLLCGSISSYPVSQLFNR